MSAGVSADAVGLRRVTIVDEDELHGHRLLLQFRGLDIQATLVRRIEDIDRPIETDLVVVEPWPISVAAAVERLRERCHLPVAPPLVVLTCCPSLAGSFDAARAGAAVYLPKPQNAAQILSFANGDLAANTEQLASPARQEWEYLQWVLALCGGNKSLSARRLGIRRSVLQRKLAKLPPSR